jgi:hypothetical protein
MGMSLFETPNGVVLHRRIPGFQRLVRQDWVLIGDAQASDLDAAVSRRIYAGQADNPVQAAKVKTPVRSVRAKASNCSSDNFKLQSSSSKRATLPSSAFIVVLRWRRFLPRP